MNSFAFLLIELYESICDDDPELELELEPEPEPPTPSLPWACNPNEYGIYKVIKIFTSNKIVVVLNIFFIKIPFNIL